MSKKIIYLSRHGQSQHNMLSDETGRNWKTEWEKVPGINDLTLVGKEQSKTLGMYLKREFKAKRVNPSGIMIVTSTDGRSIDTGDIVRSVLDLPKYNNMIHCSALCEKVPKEYIETLDPDDAARKVLSTAKTKEEIGCDTVLTLEMIADQDQYRHIIALLHGCINTLLLNYAGLGTREMDNCSLITLEYYGKCFRIIDSYKTNDELKKALGARRVSEGGLL